MNKAKLFSLLMILLMLSGCRVSTEQVMVPEITGLTINEADQRLKLVGLSMEVQETIELGRIVESKILSQNPRGKLLAKKGSVVYVVVGMGLRKVEVPELTGLSHLEAEKKLSDLGLVIRELIYQENDKISLGTVLKQSLTAGELAFPGDGIVLTLSSGKWVDVPLIRGLKVVEAENILKATGLKVGTITPEGLRTDKTAIITEQFPEENQRIPINSMVNIKVKKGG